MTTNQDLESKLSDLERQISEINSKVDNVSTDQGREDNTGPQQTESFNKLIETLRGTQPSWQKDGGGVRGNQPITQELGPKIQSITKFNFTQTTLESQKLETEGVEVTPQQVVGGGGGGSVAHPWKITTRTVPESDPPEYEYAIEPTSKLFNGFGGTQVTVIGADGVFRSVGEGGYCFIEVNFSNGAVQQAQIQINENIGPFIVTSGTSQTLRQQIGYIYFDSDSGVPIVIQNAWHNYTLFDVCRNGVPIKATIAT